MQKSEKTSMMIIAVVIAIIGLMFYLVYRSKKEADVIDPYPDEWIPYKEPETEFYCKRGDPCSVSDIEMKWDLGESRLIYTLTGKAYLKNYGWAINRQMSIKADGIQIWQSSGTYGSGEESINAVIGRNVRVFTFIGFRMGKGSGKCTIESLEAHIL